MAGNPESHRDADRAGERRDAAADAEGVSEAAEGVPDTAALGPVDAAGASAVDTGILVGVLIGEGHFGGDGKQPQVTLRMHTDHQALFEWILARFGGKLYGPYHHGGRSYFQWMARGPFLRETLLPILEEHLRPELDAKSFARYRQMRERYEL